MKPYFHFLQRNRPRIISKLLSVAGAGVISVCLFAGCKKNNAAEIIPEPDTNAIVREVSHAPVYSANPVTPPATVTPQGDPDFAEMNREVRRWILGNRRAPKNFEEFAASTSAKFPPPPAGKKYAIDKSMHVILVNK